MSHQQRDDGSRAGYDTIYDTHHRPPARTERSGDYRDQPGYRRKQRIAATIIFWLFWVALGVAIAALDASFILHQPGNIDTPKGWAQLVAMVVTFITVVSSLTSLFRWAARNRYK